MVCLGVQQLCVGRLDAPCSESKLARCSTGCVLAGIGVGLVCDENLNCHRPAGFAEPGSWLLAQFQGLDRLGDDPNRMGHGVVHRNDS